MHANQFSLDLAPPMARRLDPVASKVAAFKAREFQVSHAQKIVEALKTGGPMTAHEIGHLTGLTVVQIDRRVAELRRAGLVAAHANTDCTTATRRTPTGGIATVWEVVA